MRTYSCTCGSRLFFDNTRCLNCQREVGWCPVCQGISALEPLAEGGFRCTNAECGAALLKCFNYLEHDVCNRMIPLDGNGEADALCDCCRYNDVVPDLSIEGHRERWAALEAAKRRLFYTLDLLGLPHGTAEEGFEPPLSFSFMADALPDAGLWRSTAGTDKVYTGHAEGHITINVKEADDVERERLRVDMHESHRTLIGHFRHEIGHYYWDLLVKGRDEAASREVFGDHDSPPYGEALERYYESGPPDDWAQRYVSAYATMHPWEDFAETFAFYLDIVAVLDTAHHLGVSAADHDASLTRMLAAFHQVGLGVNELNREMGLTDLVPEVVTPAIRDKLAYVHQLIHQASG
ncbi:MULTISPECIES: putative zinc-binding metallopeptidase [unclassified Modicisalibacter]|uniref:zinc-binding metallopeptidase family protein n=1 Tax=unclassified Modicisalibacter TaxID=2679913 RepID=UPI001CCF7EA8|nr:MULTISPECIES: putative zinc-binding metallopeptidase [unclassified Modicisalibacter]MBZ9556616.1 putative zinc-binding metallopeptidase [Modicisalibacter sp. R2A 31.J]MBZ9574915.1 putative zinc-binding metallopeptidase [Modicisalibacter sp. MOD 31.J]